MFRTRIVTFDTAKHFITQVISEILFKELLNEWQKGYVHITFLPLVYCLVGDTLFEVSPEICHSAVSSLYCCYGNHTAYSKPS